MAQNVTASPLVPVVTRQPCPPAVRHAAIASLLATLSDSPHPTPILLLSWLMALDPQAFWNHRTSWQLLGRGDVIWRHLAKASLRAEVRLFPNPLDPPPHDELLVESAIEPYELPEVGVGVDRAGNALASPDGVAEPALAQTAKGLPSTAEVTTRQLCPPAVLHAAIAFCPATFSDVSHPTPALLLSWLTAIDPQAFRNHRTS